MFAFLFLFTKWQWFNLITSYWVFMYSLNSVNTQGIGSTLVNKTKSLSWRSLQNHLWLTHPSVIIILCFLGVDTWSVQFNSRLMISQSLNTLLFRLLHFLKGISVWKVTFTVQEIYKTALGFTSCLCQASKSPRGEWLRSYTFSRFSLACTEPCAWESPFGAPGKCWNFSRFLPGLPFTFLSGI